MQSGGPTASCSLNRVSHFLLESLIHLHQEESYLDKYTVRSPEDQEYLASSQTSNLETGIIELAFLIDFFLQFLQQKNSSGSF